MQLNRTAVITMADPPLDAAAQPTRDLAAQEVVDMDLTDRVAVVTGASSGLGRRMALDLAARGAVVTALARRADRLREVEEEMRRSSPASSAITCDVSDIDGYVDVLHQIEARHGSIDVLINNAGISEQQGDGLDPYRRVMETNYFAPVAGTLAVLPGMRARRDGDVVNVSSDTARAPTAREPGYAAAKAALSAFTEGLSFDAERDGVRLHVLYPGWVPTEMTREADGTLPDDLPPKMVRRTDEQVSRLVLDRLGSDRFEIDATKIARIAPIAKALFPKSYRKGLVRAAG
jgi:NAD(P)-dependent dehydrogenase (short-subunit alcohol dehydrogenase family)